MSRAAASLVLALLTAPAIAGGPSAGKPGAPVEIAYTLVGKPRAGMPFEVEIRITTRGTVDEVRLDYGTSEQMTLDRGMPQTLSLIKQKQGVPALQRVLVVPKGDGLHFLKVRVVTVAAGRTRMSGIAIPIGVGKYDDRSHLRRNGTLIEGVGGERAVVMRAAEG